MTLTTITETEQLANIDTNSDPQKKTIVRDELFTKQNCRAHNSLSLTIKFDLAISNRFFVLRNIIHSRTASADRGSRVVEQNYPIQSNLVSRGHGEGKR